MANPLDAAPRFVAQAVAGVRRYGKAQDEMLRLEAEVPGFGGFFIDGDGEVVAYLQPSAAARSAALRAALHRVYSARPEAIVREIMANARNAKVIDAQYSFAQLIAIEEAIVEIWLRSPVLLESDLQFRGIA